MSFCSQTQQLPVFQMFISCAFFGSSWSIDTAKQVTCVVRWHMLYQLHFCLDVVTSFSLLCLKVFFPPTQFFQFVPVPFSNKCIHGFLFIHTDMCPSCTRQVSCQLSTIKKFWHVNLYVSRYIARPTAWKRGCGKCHSHFPTFKKGVRLLLRFLLWAVALELPGS